MFETRKAALLALGLELGESTQVLAADWEATQVHGLTGQDVSEDRVAEGQYVRDLISEPREDGVEYRALVSPDAQSWYRYRSYAAPFVR